MAKTMASQLRAGRVHCLQRQRRRTTDDEPAEHHQIQTGGFLLRRLAAHFPQRDRPCEHSVSGDMRRHDRSVSLVAAVGGVSLVGLPRR